MKRFALVLGAAICFLGLSSNPAQAAFKLEIDDLGTLGVDFLITDNGAGDLLPLVTGSISFSGSTATFTVLVAVGNSKPIIGNPGEAHLKLTSVAVSAAGGGILRIRLTDTDFTIVTPPNEMVMRSMIGGVATLASVDVTQTLDLGNVEFSPTPDITITHATKTGAFSEVLTSGAIAYLGTSFSMTEDVTLSFAGAGSVASGDFDSIAFNPEPTTLAISLSALPFLGAMWTRRRRKVA